VQHLEDLVAFRDPSNTFPCRPPALAHEDFYRPDGGGAGGNAGRKPGAGPPRIEGRGLLEPRSGCFAELSGSKRFRAAFG
jgi:hypothetical protein